MFDTGSRKIIAEIAKKAGIEPLALFAVAEVESGGKAFARIDGRLEPVIRFEPHYFDRRLSNDQKRRARDAGLASPLAEAIANPVTQGGRWKMLQQAAKIDRQAALESVSWGIGQVMGAHWAWLGYANVEALVEEARSGLAGQARLMVRYIGKSGMCGTLNRHDWAAFARAYNGPGYRRNAYQRKLARAYARYRRLEDAGLNSVAAATRPAPRPEQSLGYGDRGAAVSRLQRMLSTLGYPLLADGIYGSRTRIAVRRFQANCGLEMDGVAGPWTMARIARDFELSPAWPAILARIAMWLRSFWSSRAIR